MILINRWKTKIRNISQRGKGITIPSNSIFNSGDKVTVYYDSFILIVPDDCLISDGMIRVIKEMIDNSDSARS